MGWGEPQGADGAARLAPVPLERDVRCNPPGSTTLSSTEWEGTDPRVGDVLVLGVVYRVDHVVRGAGFGHFTLEVSPTLEVPRDSAVHLWRV